jgi:polyisoprenoid-binding protein YceI
MAVDAARGTRLSTDIPPETGKQTVWEIDAAHSLIEFSVKHMMFTTVKGRFSEVRGTITCPDEADPSCASVEATIDTASIDTGDEKRDAHLRSADFLDVEHYPTITFKSTRVERAGQDEMRVIGDLTIRGVTHQIALATTYNGRGKNPWGKDVAGFTAETQLNRKDFGLQWNVALESGGLLVGDKLNVLIEVQAIKQD